MNREKKIQDTRYKIFIQWELGYAIADMWAGAMNMFL